MKPDGIFRLKGDFVFASYLIRLKTSNRILPEFLNYSYGKSEIKKRAKRAVSQANVNAKELCSIKINLPSISDQQKIVEKLEAVQNYKKLLQKEKELLKELFDSVLDKSMRGELDN